MRVTDKDLGAVFARLVSCAESAGKDTTNWVFGQHTGQAYWVAVRDPKNGSVSAVSRQWSSKREAYNGMHDMIQALVLPKGRP